MSAHEDDGGIICKNCGESFDSHSKSEMDICIAAQERVLERDLEAGSIETKFLAFSGGQVKVTNLVDGNLVIELELKRAVLDAEQVTLLAQLLSRAYELSQRMFARGIGQPGQPSMGGSPSQAVPPELARALDPGKYYRGKQWQNP